MMDPKILTAGEETKAEAFAKLGGKNLVYVRPVMAGDVMGDLVDEENEIDMDIPAETVLYALHAADGARIALMGNRDLAFAAARQNELTPVSVH